MDESGNFFERLRLINRNEIKHQGEIDQTSDAIIPDGIKNFIKLLFGIMISFGLLIFFLKGIGWIEKFIYPWLHFVSGVMIIMDIFLLVPMAFFKRTRHFAGNWIASSSYIFGLTLWVLGFILTFNHFGFWGIIFGLIIAGIGVVPIAMIGTIITGTWSLLFDLVLLTFLTFGGRFLGFWLLAKVEHYDAISGIIRE